MKRLLKRVVIIAVLLIAVAVGVGLTLPTAFEVTRTVQIAATPAEIHRYMGDLSKWDEWTPWKEADPSIVVTPGDRTTGIGAGQSWVGRDGDGSLQFTMSSPEKGIEYDLYFDGGRYRSQATMHYQALQSGTQVTWVMRGDMGTPVIGGYLSMLMDRMAGDMFENGLNKLKQVVENKT